VHRIDTAERRARLARRHRIAPEHRAADVEGATQAMVCLHATDPATVYLSAWSRVDPLKIDDVDRALYQQRTVVKHLAMRRTLFVVPRETLAIVQAAASRQVAETERRRLIGQVAKAELFDDPERWFDTASSAVLRVLADGREATSSQLRDEVPELVGTITYGEGKKWGGEIPIGPRVLTVLSANGRIVRASNLGGWTTSRPAWASTESWLGHEIEPVPEEVARARLVEQWLRVFGPGTVADIKWWLGSTVAAVRQALADIGAVEVELDGGATGYVMADDVDDAGSVEPWVALLPMLDPTTMGWFERDWYLGPHKAQLFDRSGNAGPTVWCDGRIVGGWRQGESGDVVVDLLEDVGRQAGAAIEVEAARLTDWLGGVQVPPRFPSPLFQVGAKRSTSL
jgi:hypothetical protein